MAGTATRQAPIRRADAPRWLRPATVPLARLRTSARLGVLVAVLLIPAVFATASFGSAIGGQISFAASERWGVVVLRPALAALAATTSGDPVDLSELSAKARPYHELDKPMSTVTAAVAELPAKGAAGRLAVAQSLVDLVTEIGNSSKLILDPDLDSFYLMDASVVQLPKALLAALQAATPAAGLAPQQQVAARAVVAGTLTGAGDALRSDVETALQNTSWSGAAGRMDGLRRASSAAGTLASGLTAHLNGSGSVDVSALTAAAADGAALDALDALLVRRSNHLSARRTDTLAVTAVGLLFAVWIGAAVWWRTRRDVTLAVAGVRAIAAHDLEPKLLPDGSDELGDIGRAVALARQELAGQDEALRQADAQRGTQQREHFRQMRTAEHEARRRAQAMIDDTASTVITELTAVLEQFGEVAESASGIDRSVREVDTVARGVVDQAAEADRMVSALSESLGRVAAIAGLIDRVAEQTKLLALNATIEAVRAGEEGRGFAVVAGEVKQLATATATSTGEIATTISVLERDADDVSGAISAMAGGVGAVDTANASLSGVAGRQGELVARVSDRLREALGRTRSMLSLSEQLERRAAERVPASGTGRLRSGGSRQLAFRLCDLSESGVRVALEGGPAPRWSVGDRVELDFVLETGLDTGLTTGRDTGRDTGEVHCRAAFVRTAETDEVAFRFEPLDASARTAIRSYVGRFVGEV